MFDEYDPTPNVTSGEDYKEYLLFQMEKKLKEKNGQTTSE
jgi:hypothetical protein